MPGNHLDYLAVFRLQRVFPPLLFIPARVAPEPGVFEEKKHHQPDTRVRTRQNFPPPPPGGPQARAEHVSRRGLAKREDRHLVSSAAVAPAVVSFARACMLLPSHSA
ncbi:hypothetical protein MRX96_044356 [Rhipicephalus microplus]